MSVLALRKSSAILIIGSALCLYSMSALVLAQGAGDDASKKAPKEHMVITSKNRDQVLLTPEQQDAVDKLSRLPGTANDGVLNRV